MALALFDRVQETTTTTGTGSVTLAGAVPGFQSFAVVGNGNTCYYTIVDGSAWEVGIGTYSTSGPTLARTTVLSNSNGNTSPITLAAGTKSIFLTYPAEKSVNLDASDNVSPLGTVSSGVWQGSTVGVAYGGTGVTASSGANSVVLRDGSQNIAVNRVNQANTNTTAAGGTTALTAASSYIHTLVGTGGQTYTLPDATTLTTGVAFVFNNLATGTLTIANYAGTTIGTVPSGGAGAVFLTLNSTVGGTWDLHAYLPEGVTFGTNAFNLGTSIISGGTWQGGTIQTGYGGTGLTSYTSGGAVYANSSSTLTSGTLPVTAGGTGATTAAGAQSSLNVPSTTGSGASGTWGISVSGNSATTSQTNFSNLTIASSQVLSAANYNSYAPTLTGGGASGTWGINITGNASGSSTSVNTSSSSGIQSNYTASINTTTPGLANYGVLFLGQAIADNAQGITWTWSNAGTAQAGIYVQSSGAYGTKMYFGTTDSFATGSKTSMSIDHVGVVQIPRNYLQSDSSLRAPIFYDSNDTGYYVDPNSNSRLSSISVPAGSPGFVNAARGSTFGYSSGYGTIIYGVTSGSVTPCFNVDPIANPSGSFNGNGGEVMFRNGVQFISPNSSNNGYNNYFVLQDGYAAANNSFRAPIFYDSNDTGYYLDPNSTGLALATNGIVSSGTGTNGGFQNRTFTSGRNRIWSFGNADTYGISYFQGGPDYIGLHVSGTATQGGSDFWVSSQGISQTSVSSRAPIFYDSNNTAYYLDPNGNSVLTTAIFYVNGSSDITLTAAGTNASMIKAGSGDELYIGGNNTWQMRFSGANVLMDNGGYLLNGESIRSPLFYDSSNTAYYVDPAPGSNGVSANFQGRIQVGTFNNSQTNSGEAWLGRASDRSSGTFTVQLGGGSSSGRSFEVVDYAWTVVLGSINSDGNSFAYSSYRAPIFYDRDDTAYYLNPNSSSFLYGLVLSGNQYFRPNTWIQCDTSAGIYWPNHYGAHFYPNGSSTYTQLQIDGSKNSYSGMYISHSAVNGMMYDSAGNGGVYREANGKWYFYYLVSNDCMGIGTSSTNSAYGVYCNKGAYFGARVDGTIFYDANSTAYYLDPSSSGLSLSSNGIVSSGTGGGFQNAGYQSGRNRIWSFGNSDGYGISYFQGGGGYGGSDSIGIHFGSPVADCNFIFRGSSDFIAKGNVTAYSDERLKTDWSDVCTGFVEALAKVKSGTYTRTDTGARQAGVSAQSLQTVLPETVLDEGPHLAVAYGNAAMVSAVELAKYVTALEQRISQLEARL